MTVEDLLSVLNFYEKKHNDNLMDIRLFSDGSGRIYNRDDTEVYAFDDYEDFVLDKFGCKECNGTGLIEKEEFYTVSDNISSHTFKNTYSKKCPLCGGKGYIL